MQRLSVVLAVATIVCLTTVASAHEKPFMVHADVGYCKVLAEPLGSYTPSGSLGLATGFIYRFQETRKVGVGAEVGYLMLGSANETDFRDRPTSKRTWSVIPVTGQIYFFGHPEKTTPVLTAGLGLYHFKEQREDLTDDPTPPGEWTDTTTGVGFDFGGGMLFVSGHRSQPRFGIDGRLHVFKTDVLAAFGAQKLITIMARLYL